jgi:glutathionylspermidine synthase
MIDQKTFTEEVLFNHYMVSSTSEKSVHCQIPFYIEKYCYDGMVYYAEEINKIALKILKDLNKAHKRFIPYIDDFPFKEEILSLNCDISPLFWTRFDTFRDEDNRVFFAEFNYDKPCAQKEIGLAGAAPIDNNVNRAFEKEFVKELQRIAASVRKKDEVINVAVLIDPCHYEEFHLAFYFKHILRDSDINIIQVGPKNFSVKDNRVYAYKDLQIHIILRLFPTEYLYEVNSFKEILQCFQDGNVLLINDPRVIAIQAKSLFAYLWELVEEKSDYLSKEEQDVIRSAIPYTVIFTPDRYEEVINHKDKYVVKASFGRYSGEVYIGKLYTHDQWKEEIDKVLKSNKLHILQQVINIKEEYTYYVDNNNMNVPTKAYGNFGTYIINEKVQGLCVRWSSDFLTDNSSTWMCPIGIKDYRIHIDYYDSNDRKALWDKIIERAIFEYNFTGAHDNTEEYISLDSFILEDSRYREIEYASLKFCNILDKTSELIKGNFPMFSEILGIPESLRKVILNSRTEEFCAIGRIDFAIDNDGNLKIFEFNSETPAGLVESIGISEIIKEELQIPYINPNAHLREHIKDVFSKILKDFSKEKEIKNIGFLSSSYYEDLYTTKILSDICKDVGDFNVITGNIYDLEVINDKLYIYGTPLDVIYRYFPLDWFEYEEELSPCIDALNKNTFVLNPTHTLIAQSKAIFAVIYELIGKDFYTDDEEAFINKYIPYTCLEPNERLSMDCVVKPYLSREGQGVVLSHEGIEKGIEDVVFQERVNIAPFTINKYSYLKTKKAYGFPVIGVYVAGKKFSGIYTRIGDFVTNTSAKFMSTYIRHLQKNK